MTQEESDLLHEYRNVGTNRRGMILNESIALERAIDYYIASHFCKEEKQKQEIHELILSTERMTFAGKIMILQYLISKYEQEFLKQNSHLFEKLESIMKRRNIFAHYQLDMSIEAANHFRDTTECTFIKYTNGIDWKKYSKEKCQLIMDDIFYALSTINDLNKSNKLKG